MVSLRWVGTPGALMMPGEVLRVVLLETHVPALPCARLVPPCPARSFCCSGMMPGAFPFSCARADRSPSSPPLWLFRRHLCPLGRLEGRERSDGSRATDARDSRLTGG